MGAQKDLCEPIPNLRGYGTKRYRKHLGVAVILAGLGALLFHQFVTVRNKNIVREFYSTYDAEAAFERMKDRGLFKCVAAPPTSDAK